MGFIFKKIHIHIIYCHEFAPLFNSVYPRPHELCVNNVTYVLDRLLMTSLCVQCTFEYTPVILLLPSAVHNFVTVEPID